MKKHIFFTITLIFLLLGAQTTLAAAQGWELDNAHSNFYFSIRHIFSQINGRFNDFSGEVQFDPKNLAESRFFFTIKTASIDTNIAKRDEHLRSADFFNEEKFPTMTFESSKITDIDDNVYEVLGKFTVKGKTYDLVLPLTLTGVKDHPAEKEKEVIGFNGKLTIDRLAYKIGDGKFYDMGMIGKDVEIHVSLEALSNK